MSPKKSFLSDEEMEKIRHAVAQAEEGTFGEIATMVVEESDSYREALLLGVLFISGFVALLVSITIQHVTIWSYIPLVLVLMLPCYQILKIFPRLKIFFVERKRLNEAVRDRAVKAFYEKGLYRTKQETGVLIFISLLEHKVWILGDRVINEKIRPESWQSLAAELAIGIRQGKACESLCAIIQSCGEELAKHFPRAPGAEINELSDEIII